MEIPHSQGYPESQSRGVGGPPFPVISCSKTLPGSHLALPQVSQNPELGRYHMCPWCHTTGAGQSPGTPIPFGGSSGEIFLWVVAPFICKPICKPMTRIIPVTANPAKFNSFNSFPKLFCLNYHPPTPVCVTDTESSPSSSQELITETLPKEVT